MFKFGKLPSAVIAIALTVAMLFSVAIPTLAYTASVGSVADDVNGKEIVGQDVDQGKQTEYSDAITVGNTTITSDCDVYATVPDSGIVVTVPKVQILDGKSAAANVGVYTVAVRGDISAKTVITVEPQDEMDDRDGVNFEMTSAGKAGIPTDVDQAKTMFTYADGVRPDTPATTTGTITAHGMTAGIWNGDFEFNISTSVTQPKDETTYYTPEEIDESEYLIPIGKTDPYYVVVAFNEDYTEATITKNGAESDGLMMDWVDLETGDISVSPMAEKASTLTVINIQDGVKNIGAGAMFNTTGYMSVGSVITQGPDVNTQEGSLEAMENYNFHTITETVPTLDLGDFALTTVNVNGNTLTEIGDAAFAFCNNLKNVTLNDEITKISFLAFAFTDLENFGKLPANLERIGCAAFWISGIKHVEFGNKISVIEGQAFQLCTFIENDIYLPTSITDIGETDNIGNTFNSTGIYTFYGEAGSYAEGWASRRGYTFVAV